MNPFDAANPFGPTGGQTVTVKDESGTDYTGPVVPWPYIEKMVDARLKAQRLRSIKATGEAIGTLLNEMVYPRLEALEAALGRDLTETTRELDAAIDAFLEE
ncbi:MAG: hypothetical protein ABJX32_06210 [Tateyamaria sp.]|uniref:hypothetical protein n=1 Tax=Tateyamaria sp. TaxID=1929288 RepID=UPI00329F1419